MRTLSRRSFMKGAGVAAAGLALGPAMRAPAAEPLTATSVRTLGKTGIQCSFLGMGTGVKSWNGVSELTRRGREHYLSLLDHAYAQGLRYFDMADMYGAHDYMKESLKKGIRRDGTMLLSKTVSREADLLKADIERFRKELDTDVIDVVLLHCLTTADWATAMRPCMDALADAKAKGQIRAHGCSCHDKGAMETAAECEWVDVMLARINPFGIKMDGAPEEISAILKKAHDNGKGILGMKILGEGEAADRIDESLKYVMGLGCVDAITIGFLKHEEVEDTVGRIRAISAA